MLWSQPSQLSAGFRPGVIYTGLTFRELTQAKQKYEKLLTQCANLTAMIDASASEMAGDF